MKMNVTAVQKYYLYPLVQRPYIHLFTSHFNLFLKLQSSVIYLFQDTRRNIIANKFSDSAR